jgi:hypothetical protein
MQIAPTHHAVIRTPQFFASTPLPEGSSREARLFCRLLPSEVAEIEAAAKMVKKSKSDWIREVLLAAARRRPKVR